MTEITYLYLKIMLVGWYVAYFEPLQAILASIKEKISDKYYAVFYLKTALSCWKCLCLWIGLIWGINTLGLVGIYPALAASFTAMLISKALKI